MLLPRKRGENGEKKVVGLCLNQREKKGADRAKRGKYGKIFSGEEQCGNLPALSGGGDLQNGKNNAKGFSERKEGAVGKCLRGGKGQKLRGGKKKGRGKKKCAWFFLRGSEKETACADLQERGQ